MNPTNIREELLTYVAEAPEQKLEALYALLEHDMPPAGISREQWHLIEEAHERYLSGESKPVPLTEVQQDLESRLRRNAA